MEHVHLKWLNNSYLKVITEPQVLMELNQYLTFFAPNYKYHPKFKRGFWDGKIYVFNRFDMTTFTGLARHIKRFCDERRYKITWDSMFDYVDVTPHHVVDFIKTLNLPPDIKTTDDYSYQPKAVWKAIRAGRRTLEVGTSGGKSLIIYLLHCWYNRHEFNKSLIIVPTTALVDQFKGDLRDYGFEGRIVTSNDPGGLSHDENIDADVVISTWQAIDNGKKKTTKSEEWCKQFRVIFGDEAHECAAPTLLRIMSKMINARYRFGLTGTMPEHSLQRINVEGLFGPHHFVIDARGLIERGVSTDVEIRRIVFKHPEHICKMMQANSMAKNKTPGQKYQEEYKYLVECRKRTLAIANLVNKLQGNRIVFFRQKDHGKHIQDACLALDSTQNILYIDGDVKAKDRNEMRSDIEDADDAILLASLGTTKRGVNIKKLHSAVMAAPTKSLSNVVQPIGRLIRKHESKDKVIIYDIVDDMSVGQWMNYTLRHAHDRVAIYDKQRHPHKTTVVKLNYE